MGGGRTIFVCRGCGTRHPVWEGRCRGCGEWGTLSEREDPRHAPPPHPRGGGRKPAGSAPPPIVPLCDVETAGVERVSAGIGELDRVLGGGWVPGSAVLIGGDPGIGKSTLLLELAAGAAAAGQRAVYVSGEESPAQVKIRAVRLGLGSSPLLMLPETDLDAVLGRLEGERPALVVVDSIQTVCLASLASSPGSVAQVRECGAALVAYAKRTGSAVFLVGHVTKEGSIAGPRVLEHLVDTVLYFEGDPAGEYRVLRATKNRFGPVQEIGVFSMEPGGLREVPNPSERLFRGMADPAPGSIAFPILEGSRILVVEIQAIAAPSSLSQPTRRASGVDPNRIPLLLAVLEKKVRKNLWRNDVFVNVVGGIQAGEPAADLSVCLAILSSLLERPVSHGTAAAGEVGLTGEVRGISHPELRAQEVARLGLERLVVARESASKIPKDLPLEVVGVPDLAGAVVAVLGGEGSGVTAREKRAPRPPC